MNDKKISIIIVKKNNDSYQEQLACLGALAVPEGFVIDVATIDDEKSYARAYNRASQLSDAKYKVYIAESTRIINPDFFHDILRLFQSDAKIGLLGIHGTEQLATSGKMEESARLYGRVLHKDGSVRGTAFSTGLKQVMAVDGRLLATQYDLPWREDLFEDLQWTVQGQCLEFQRQGYSCVVPEQHEFWAIYDTNDTSIATREQECFLDEYSRDCYPLVSVIIPTYQRPVYLAEALTSVVRQTYRNLDIFITDNSHNDETENLMREKFADDSRIHYEHHAEYDAAGNWQRAMNYNNQEAEYVNWLMDDDVFHPHKIARMMDYFFRYPNVSLVTSYRQLIDAKGNIMADAVFNKPIVNNTTRLAGDMMGRSILINLTNYIGEPTTVLAKKRLMCEQYKLGWSGTEGKYLISDFPTWLRLLSQGDVIYIREPLSYFRIHGNQDQTNMQTRITGQICWALEIKQAIDTDTFFTEAEQKRKSILRWLYQTSSLFLDIEQQNWDADNVLDLRKVFQGMVSSLERDYDISFAIDTQA